MEKTLKEIKWEKLLGKQGRKIKNARKMENKREIYVIWEKLRQIGCVRYKY
jgi:hypothetical protein